MNGTTRNTSEKKSKEILYSHFWVLQVLNVSWQIPGCENKIGPCTKVSIAFRAALKLSRSTNCHLCLKLLKVRISGPVEVLTSVFSNAAPTIGSITWWRQLHKLLPDGKYLMLSYQNLMLKSGFQCPTLLSIGEQQMHDINLLKKNISSLWDVVAHWSSRRLLTGGPWVRLPI